MRVAIIGAGPSGLVALKALRAELDVSTDIKIFERRSTVGGAWNYQPQASTESILKEKQVNGDRLDGTSPSGTNPAPPRERRASETWLTPMYEDLHTNTPRDLMTFADHPFPPNTDQFPSRQEVMQYLTSYAADTLEHIAFEREVISITKETGSDQWTLQSQSSTRETLLPRQEEFDRIVVASGHYDEPRIPNIKGLAEYDARYPGRIRHSKFFRTPSPFADKRVLIVGTGPSGSDIATQIATVAKLPVLQSSRSTIERASDSSSITASVVSVPAVVEFKRDGSVSLTDGTILEDLDCILFCTGYLYHFPFLHPWGRQRKLLENGEVLRDLYQLLLYILDPSIAFLGMGQKIIPFPFSEAQACYLARVWAGRIQLPSPERMMQEQVESARRRGTGVESMVFAHPEDGRYIDWLRTRCIESDAEHGRSGKLPVDWLHSHRLTLRATTKQLKADWARKRHR